MLKSQYNLKAPRCAEDFSKKGKNKHSNKYYIQKILNKQYNELDEALKI